MELIETLIKDLSAKQLIYLADKLLMAAYEKIEPEETTIEFEKEIDKI